MARIQWIPCKTPSVDDRGDIVTLFAADGFGSLLYSEEDNNVYKVQDGQWYYSRIIKEDR